MPELKHLVTINAPAAAVYRALTEQEGLAGWWTVQTIARPEVGYLIDFRFGRHYHNQMEITRLEPEKRVEWICRKGEDEWVGTTYVFDLEAQPEGGTVVRFTHSDWRETTDFFARCNTIWGRYMESLKQYCETGRGNPFSPD